MSDVDGVSRSKSPSWLDEYDKPSPGAAEKTAQNVANSPWLATAPATKEETALAHPPAIFTNPAMLGAPVVLAPPPPAAPVKPAALAAAPNARHGVTLANLAEDVPKGTRTDQTRAFTCGAGYKLYPEVARQLDGKDAILYWTAFNAETKRVEFLVGPDSLTAFTSAPKDFATAAANGFMGDGDEVTHESVKAVDVAMRKGVGPAVGQLWHASGVAWSNPDWAAKTVANVASAFVGSTDAANRMRLDQRAVAAERSIAQPDANHFIEHINKDLPLGKMPGTRDMNCANAAIATDATLAGTPTSAVPGEVTHASVLQDYFGTKWSPATGQASSIEASMQGAGPGSRGIVFGQKTGEKIGHFFNVANQGGTVRFLDGQGGGLAKLKPYDTFFLLRTN